MESKDKKIYMKNIIEEIDSKKDELVKLSQYIWENPELGYKEIKAKEALCNYLEKQGFEVNRDVAGLETAFVAVKNGKGKGPKVAIMSEYDALPEIGHACGHNVFSVASIGAAIGVGKVLKEIDGSVSVIGTPAEEGTVPNAGSKAILIENGVFDDIDAAMMCHAEGRTIVERQLVASATMQASFKGKPAHAGGSPHEGINALTAGVLTINNINALRQHFLPRVIVNPIITEGGVAQNTIPDKCSMKFSIRSEKKAELYKVLEKVEKCIEAAALVTGCTYEHSLSNYIYEDLTPNHVLSNSFKANLDLLEVPYLDFESANYAWDVGNVSYVCPTIAPYIKIGPENLIGHTEGFKAASNSPEGFDGMIIGAKAMALTTLDYLTSEELRKEVAAEFKFKVKE